MSTHTVAPSRLANGTLPTPEHPDPSEVVMVTPDMAAEYLSHNTHNRNLRSATTTAYAMDMTNGDWRWTGDPIRFAEDGTLLDGQHRLAAVVEAGVTLPFMVLRGLPRSIQDVLALRGETSANALAALTRKVYDWNLGTRSFTQGGARPTTASLLSTLEENPGLREMVNSARAVSDSFDLPASLIGLAWWVFSSIDTEDADFFFQRCADGQGLVKGDPIYELRRVVDASRDHRGGRAGQRNQRYLLALTIKAWNAYRKGETVTLLKFRVGGAKPETFPEPA